MRFVTPRDAWPDRFELVESRLARPRGGSAAEVGELILEAGMVFDIKPSFPFKGGATAQFGDSVVVTEKGARRLGKRELKVMTLGG